MILKRSPPDSEDNTVSDNEAYDALLEEKVHLELQYEQLH